MKGLGERLRDSVLTNAGVIGVMRLGVDDAYFLRRLFEPLTAEDLLSLPAFEIVLRMPSRDGAENWPTAQVQPAAPGSPSTPSLTPVDRTAVAPVVVAFCPKCGTRRPDDARFCTSCGTDLSPSTPGL